MSSSDSSFSAQRVRAVRGTASAGRHTLLLLLLLGSLGSTASGSGTASGSSTASAARRDGGELARALSNQLHQHVSKLRHLPSFGRGVKKTPGRTYLVDVLALELGEESVEAVAVGLNADGLEDGGDVSGRGRGVAAEAEEEVGCEVLHFDGLVARNTSASVSVASCVGLANRLGKNSLVRIVGEQERSINFNRKLGGERLF